MEKNENAHEANPGEQEQELEIQPEDKPEEKPTDLSLSVDDGDYLDKITDPDELRKEAKKFRSQKSRIKKVETLEVAEKKSEPVGEYVTREELSEANRKEAIKRATEVQETDSDNLKALKQDISDNWEQIKANYVARRGQSYAQDIYEDIIDAYNVFRGRNPKQDSTDPAKDLQRETVVRSSSALKKDTGTVKQTTHFPKPNKPESWYGETK